MFQLLQLSWIIHCMCVLYSAPLNDVGHPVSVILNITDSRTTQTVIDFLKHHKQSQANTVIPTVSEDGQVLNLEMSRLSFYHLWSDLFSPLLLSPSYGIVSIHLEGSYIVKAQQESRIKNSQGMKLIVRKLCWNVEVKIIWPFGKYKLNFVLFPSTMLPSGLACLLACVSVYLSICPKKKSECILKIGFTFDIHNKLLFLG